MTAHQIIKKSLKELSQITKVELSLCDLEGTGIAAYVAKGEANSETNQEYDFEVYDDEEVVYTLHARGENAGVVGRIAVSQVQNLLEAHREKLDRNSFIQNVLLDNLLLVDIYNRAKMLHVENEVRRVVFVIETKTEEDRSARELMKTLFASRPKDFITAIDEKSIILVRELAPDEGYEDIAEVSLIIQDMLNTEAMSIVKIAYGTIVNELRLISKSFKEAKMALEVGKIFYVEKSIFAYSTLGIGRLMFQLPMNLCEIFMKEIFGDQLPDTFDEETMVTINKFFDNNLNVSETARQLFIHRNTLVYRLEKIQKSTGLDIRVFEDAMTFKIAMMVVNYMNYMKNQE